MPNQTSSSKLHSPKAGGGAGAPAQLALLETENGTSIFLPSNPPFIPRGVAAWQSSGNAERTPNPSGA